VRDRDTGRALVEHPIPAMVSVTGSVRAGMEVASSASQTLKRSTSSWAARHQLSSSTTSTSPRRREHCGRRLLNAGQDCTGRPGCSWDQVYATSWTPREQARIRHRTADNDDALFGPVNNVNQFQRVTDFSVAPRSRVRGGRRTPVARSATSSSPPWSPICAKTR